jgi:hypothetical protein
MPIICTLSLLFSLLYSLGVRLLFLFLLTSVGGGHADAIFDVQWSPNGSLLATSCKDGRLRVIDPRLPAERALVAAWEAPECYKDCSVVFVRCCVCFSSLLPAVLVASSLSWILCLLSQLVLFGD